MSGAATLGEKDREQIDELVRTINVIQAIGDELTPEQSAILKLKSHADALQGRNHMLARLWSNVDQIATDLNRDILEGRVTGDEEEWAKKFIGRYTATVQATLGGGR